MRTDMGREDTGARRAPPWHPLARLGDPDTLSPFPGEGRLLRPSGSPRPQLRLLVIPPSSFPPRGGRVLSLGILKVAAVLEQAGHAVEMLDLSGIANHVEAFEAHLRRTSARV